MKRKLTHILFALTAQFGLTMAAPGSAADCGTPVGDGEHREMLIEQAIKETAPGGPSFELVKVSGPADRDGLTGLGVRFLAGPYSAIDYASLRIRYGRLRFDITKRVQECLGLKEELMVTSKLLPRGRHRLRIAVADMQSNEAELMLAVRVR
jgi:hypothetical protein